MNVREILGGVEQSPARSGVNTHADSNLSPRDLSFPRGDALQTLIDIATLILCAFFVCIIGVGITAAIFILLFVRV